MAHLIVEYSDNLNPGANIGELLKKANQTLIAQQGVFPVGGIRSRAIALKDYCVADGEDDYAFVHLTLKVGFGRSEEVKQKFCNELFDMVKAHFAQQFAERYLAISMEMSEFSEQGTWKHNNIHAKFKKDK